MMIPNVLSLMIGIYPLTKVREQHFVIRIFVQKKVTLSLSLEIDIQVFKLLKIMDEIIAYR